MNMPDEKCTLTKTEMLLIMEALDRWLVMLQIAAEEAMEGDRDPEGQMDHIWADCVPVIKLIAKIQGVDPKRAVALARRSWAAFASEYFDRQAARSPHWEGRA
jgi:hypothetical protein